MTLTVCTGEETGERTSTGYRWALLLAVGSSAECALHYQCDLLPLPRWMNSTPPNMNINSKKKRRTGGGWVKFQGQDRHVAE